MSDPDHAASADASPDEPAAKRRAFFPGLFGKGNAAEGEEPAPPAAPEPPAGSLTQRPAPAEPAASIGVRGAGVVSPRITLPTDPTPIAPMIPPAPQPTNPGHAVAQLTLSFGITALQLTPFFRLGSLDLKSLSNTATLHLVAAGNAQEPLAAGISFQIDHVELDGARIRFLRLKPLNEARQVAAPLPNLQVNDVAVTSGGDAPITVRSADQQATAVQLVGTFAVAGIDFSPAFEVESMRLEPASQTAMLRVVPSSRPAALDLPPSFDFAEVRLGEGAQLDSVRLVPTAARAA